MPEPIQELIFENLKRLRDDMALVISTCNFLAEEMRGQRDQLFDIQRRQIEMEKVQTAMETRLAGVETRLAGVEMRLAEMDGRQVRMDERLLRIEQRLGFQAERV